MSKEKKNKAVPKLRFPEFNNIEQWEKKIINEYLDLLTDFEANGSFADVKKNVTIYNEPNYAWYVRATDLENNSSSQDVKYIDEHSYKFLRKTSLTGGELLITKRGEIGKVFFFVNNEKYNATVAPNLYLLKMNKKAVPRFFFYYFTSTNGNKSLVRLNASSTIGALYKDDVKNIELFIPNYEEQKKIASCLSSLDDLITAHTQKLDALKAHKKGLMQQLFPAEGAKVPKLRFEEFKDSEEWKEKIFDQLFQIGSGRDYKHLSAGDIPVYGSGGYMLYVDDYLYDGESACIGRKGTIDKPIFLTGKFWAVDTLFYTHSFVDCIPKFIFYIFQNTNWKKYNEAGGVPSLSKTTIGKIEVLVPKPNEQQKIADCLTSLDELMSVEEEKIAQLKMHKKGLMQGLFPIDRSTN